MLVNQAAEGQGVEAPQEHGVHVDEVGGDDAASPSCQELFPSRAGAAGHRVDPGIMQDLPDRGGSNRVAEPDEFALHPPVSPCGSSVTMRITSFRITAAVGGHPGCRRLV
jgi:hypothetical protein